MSSTDHTVTLSFNLHDRDPSFPDERKEYSVAYSVIEPATASSSQLPVLVLLHPFNNARAYWRPQLDDPQLDAFTKIVVDAAGFAHSRTSPRGAPWSFDLAAESVLLMLDQLAEARGGSANELKAVTYGDSMGGAHTGLRAALRSEERRKNGEGGKGRVVGVVACGTAAEGESDDFVKEYTQNAEDFAAKVRNASTPSAVAAEILAFAEGMAAAGYTESTEEPFASARAHGTKVINDSLTLTLGLEDGKVAGDAMVTNYRCLNHRIGLIEKLSVRPSLLGDVQVLVVHGTDDAAYPFERKYHERTITACGEDNAELYVVQGGPHFVTASHAAEVDKRVVDWIKEKKL